MYGKPKKPIVETSVEQTAPIEQTPEKLALERLAQFKELAKPYNGKLGFNPFFFLLKVSNLINEKKYEEVLSLDTPTEDTFRV